MFFQTSGERERKLNPSLFLIPASENVIPSGPSRTARPVTCPSLSFDADCRARPSSGADTGEERRASEKVTRFRSISIYGSVAVAGSDGDGGAVATTQGRFQWLSDALTTRRARHATPRPLGSKGKGSKSGGKRHVVIHDSSRLLRQLIERESSVLHRPAIAPGKPFQVQRLCISQRVWRLQASSRVAVGGVSAPSLFLARLPRGRFSCLFFLLPRDLFPSASFLSTSCIESHVNDDASDPRCSHE